MIAKIRLFFSETILELRKVKWPTRKLLFYHTILVIVSILVTGAVVAAIDFGLAKILEIAIIVR